MTKFKVQEITRTLDFKEWAGTAMQGTSRNHQFTWKAVPVGEPWTVEEARIVNTVVSSEIHRQLFLESQVGAGDLGTPENHAKILGNYNVLIQRLEHDADNSSTQNSKLKLPPSDEECDDVPDPGNIERDTQSQT